MWEGFAKPEALMSSSACSAEVLGCMLLLTKPHGYMRTRNGARRA